jgi:hypothetical protein
MTTPKEIQALLDNRTRELSSRGNDDFDSNPREVYKDLKIKRNKDVSRTSCEETDSPCPPDAYRQASPKANVVAEDGGVNSITPAITSSRGFTGISVQHAKTKQGIKLFVTVQTPQDADNLTYLELTAELKRHNRLRELKRYDPDDYEFSELYVSTILELKELTPAQGKKVCMGRVHARGIRQEWVANMFIVGMLDDNEMVDNIIINYNGEEYNIKMDASMSPAQIKSYHSSGIYGELKKQRIAPRIETMKRKSFNP